MFQIPICPRCGCPARIVIVRKTRVRCILESDGSVGEVLSCSPDKELEEFECGGGHKWKVEK